MRALSIALEASARRCARNCSSNASRWQANWNRRSIARCTRWRPVAPDDALDRDAAKSSTACEQIDELAASVSRDRRTMNSVEPNATACHLAGTGEPVLPFVQARRDASEERVAVLELRAAVAVARDSMSVIEHRVVAKTAHRHEWLLAIASGRRRVGLTSERSRASVFTSHPCGISPSGEATRGWFSWPGKRKWTNHSR